MNVKTAENVDNLTLGEICEANKCSKAQILTDNVKTKASSSNMKVNDSKSSILTISFSNSSEPNCLPTISDSLKVRNIKLLGVIITSDLKWEANTSSLVKRGMLGYRCLSLCQNMEPVQITSSKYLRLLFAQFWNMQLLCGILD
jgi:hypothetical protein